MMDLVTFLAVVASFLLILYMISPFLSTFFAPKRMNLMGKHVLITGGSLGIGFEVAKEAYKRGAHVTIVARNERNLIGSKKSIESMDHNSSSTNQKVCTISLDVTNAAQVPIAFQKAIAENGPVDVLINCAGTSTSATFEDTPITEFHRLMEINFFGSVNTTKAVIASMKERKCGRIVFVSSQAGQVALYGFSAYSPTKFALRGLAEALEMELKPYNIPVTLVHPPDTDTPGFLEEEKSKPEITRKLSQTSGLYSASLVAKALLDDTERGKFMSYIGIDGFMLSCISAGMSPVISLTEAFQQFFLMGMLRIVGLGYRCYFDHVVRRGITATQ